MHFEAILSNAAVSRWSAVMIDECKRCRSVGRTSSRSGWAGRKATTAAVVESIERWSVVARPGGSTAFAGPASAKPRGAADRPTARLTTDTLRYRLLWLTTPIERILRPVRPCRFDMAPLTPLLAHRRLFAESFSDAVMPSSKRCSIQHV